MVELSPGRLVPAGALRESGFIDGIHCRFVSGSALGLPSDWYEAKILGDNTVILWKTDGNIEFYKLKGGRFVKTSSFTDIFEIFPDVETIRWDKDNLPVAFWVEDTCGSAIAKWYDMEGNELGISPMFEQEGDPPTLLCESFPSLPAVTNGVAFGRIGSIWAYSGPSEECVCWMRASEVRALLAEDWGAQEKPIIISVDAQRGDVVLEIAAFGAIVEESDFFEREQICFGFTVVSGFAKNRLYTITRAFLDGIVATRQMPNATSIHLKHFGSHWWVLGGSTRKVQWALGGSCRDGKAYAQKFCQVHINFSVINLPSGHFAFGGRALLASPAEGAPRVSHLLPGSLEQLEVEAIEAALAGLAELADDPPAGGGSPPEAGEPLPLLVFRCFILEDARVISWRALQTADFCSRPV